MSIWHQDENGHTRDKYDNYKDANEVRQVVVDGVLKYYDCDRKAYNPSNGEKFSLKHKIDCNIILRKL